MEFSSKRSAPQKNRVAIVLGGTSGIGQAIARGLARAGATTIASSRDRERVEAQAADIESLGSKTLRIPSDVQDRASLQNLCDEAVLAFRTGGYSGGNFPGC